MPNIELLKKTLSYIETHESDWDQSQYVCGTSMCFAGHAVVLSGYPVSEDAYTPLDVLPPELRAKFVPEDSWDGNSVHAAQLAAVLLGIEDEVLSEWGDPDWKDPAADVLFQSTNELSDLRQFVADLCAMAVPADAS